MMTMTTLTANPTPPWCPTNTTNISKSSSALKKLTASKFNVCYTDNPSFTTPKVLQEFPTRILPKSSTDTIINLPAMTMTATHTRKSALLQYSPIPGSLQEWNDLYNEFVMSTTYTLVGTISTSILIPESSINNDDDQLMHYHDDTPKLPEDSFNDSLKKLCNAVGELEKFNCQLFQLLETIYTSAPCMQPSHNFFDNLQQSEQWPAPQIERIPQYIFPWALPPAPWPLQPTLRTMPYKEKLTTKTTFACCGIQAKETPCLPKWNRITPANHQNWNQCGFTLYAIVLE